MLQVHSPASKRNGVGRIVYNNIIIYKKNSIKTLILLFIIDV